MSETSGWRFHLQSHPVLPSYHDIFVFTKSGNMTGIEHLLVESRSYVAARMNVYGETPLHVSKGEAAKRKVLMTMANIGYNWKRSA